MSLADVLDLLAPDPRLVPPSALAWIRPLAERLPPARLGAFEVRLRPASSRVDFQVAWRREDAKTLGEAARSLGCAPLEEFASSWDPAFDEVWLEFDQGTSLPCVFLGADVDAVDPAAVLEAMRGAAAHFRVPGDGVAACSDACRGAQRVSHLGFMLSRPDAGLRVNVKRIAPAEVTDFMRRSGLPFLEQALPVPGGFDRHVLAVDLPSGAWALECGFRGPHGPWPWDALPGPRQALEAWPELLHPGNTGPWPACLLIPALAAPGDHLAVLERRVGHVKVGPGDSVKAYLGFASYLRAMTSP